MTVTIEEMDLQPVGPRVDYEGPRPVKLSKKPCKCTVDYDNHISIDHGPRTDIYLYCPKCGCLKDILGS